MRLRCPRPGSRFHSVTVAYQQQANLISANTAGRAGQHVGPGKQFSGEHGGACGVESVWRRAGFALADHFRAEGLFGGGSSAPASAPIYTPPPPVSIDGILRAPAAGSTQQSAAPASASPARQPVSSSQTSSSPQITVQVNAMDSQSFMDRSSDIANAVREAMLNNHPINGVVTDL